MSYSVDESCGKCTPCRIGTKRLYELLTDYIDDLYNRNEIEMCARAISETIKLADVN